MKRKTQKENYDTDHIESKDILCPTCIPIVKPSNNDTDKEEIQHEAEDHFVDVLIKQGYFQKLHKAIKSENDNILHYLNNACDRNQKSFKCYERIRLTVEKYLKGGYRKGTSIHVGDFITDLA